MYTPSLPLYAPTTWGAGVLLSGKNLNHTETQFSLMTTIIDGHNHDDEIDTKAVADATFFHSTHMGLNSGMDADLIDGQSYADILANILPVGSIIWFKGTDAQIPAGWKICNGQADTNDWRDYFVIGAGGDYAVGDTAGPATYNGTITPTGTVTVGDHALTTAELPAHNHTFAEYYSPVVRIPGGGGSAVNYSVTSRTIAIGYQTEGDGTHGHTGSSISFSPVDPRPKYYALYLIKKVS